MAKVKIAFFAALVSFTVAESTDVSGIIDTDQTWNLSGSPYYIIGDTLITNGATVTIEPGVEVILSSPTSVTLWAGNGVGFGYIKALGNPTNRITFKCIINSYQHRIYLFYNYGFGSEFSYCDFIDLDGIITDGWNTLDNCNFLGINYTDKPGLLITNCENGNPSNIANNIYFNKLGDGIAINAGGGDYNMPSLSLINCEFDNISYGIAIGCLKALILSPLKIQLCSFSNCSHGISIAGYGTELNQIEILRSIFINNGEAISTQNFFTNNVRMKIKGCLFTENNLGLDITSSGDYFVLDGSVFDNNDGHLKIEKRYFKARDSYFRNSPAGGNHQGIVLDCGHLGADFGNEISFGNNLIQNNYPYDMVTPGNPSDPGLIKAFMNTWDHAEPYEIEQYDIYDANDNPGYYLDVRVTNELAIHEVSPRFNYLLGNKRYENILREKRITNYEILINNVQMWDSIITRSRSKYKIKFSPREILALFNPYVTIKSSSLGKIKAEYR